MIVVVLSKLSFHVRNIIYLIRHLSVLVWIIVILLIATPASTSDLLDDLFDAKTRRLAGKAASIAEYHVAS